MGLESKKEAKKSKDLDEELSRWRESIKKENVMLRKMLSSLKALEKRIRKAGKGFK